MSSWDGVLALTMVVRDEEEILAANLDYHLGQGVDVILVVDHGSTDGTPAILQEYERGGSLRWLRDEARPHLQDQRVNRLLRMAAEEHRADWVIHGDADEFWIPAAGSLRDVFAAIPDRYGYLRARRHDFLPAPEGGEPFYQRMIVRHRQSRNLRGTALEPKVAQRPAAGSSVAPGNHDLTDPVMPLAPDFGAVDVLHFQKRTFAQFEAKVVRNGIGHEANPARGKDTGCDQLALLEMHRGGNLLEFYESEALDPAGIERGLQRGELVLDTRLQRLMRERVVRASESPAIQDLLRRCWQAIEERDQDLRRLEQTLAERDLAMARLQVAMRTIQLESDELHRALSAVRNSRLMRSTAPLRRLYYKVRTGRELGPALAPRRRSPLER